MDEGGRSGVETARGLSRGHQCFPILDLPKRIYLPWHLSEPGIDPLAGCFGLLAKLWVLSDKYYITPLQNDIIDAIITCYTQYGRIPEEVISFVYEITSQSSSPIRKLLVRLADEYYCHHQLDRIDVRFPTEFLFDMWRRTLEFAGTVKCGECDGSTGTYPEEFAFEICFCTDFHYHGSADYRKRFARPSRLSTCERGEIDI
jgi:hypothetical protein